MSKKYEGLNMLLIILFLLLLIWTPVFFDMYSVLTACFIVIGTVMGGYFGGKLLKSSSR